METIKIIEETAPQPGIEELSETEREIIFEQLGDAGDLSSVQVDTYLSLINDNIKYKNLIFTPTIPELIIRKIFEMSRNVQTIPIIFPIIDDWVKKRGSNIALSGYKISFDFIQPCFTLSGKLFMNASNKEIEILGFLIRDECNNPRFNNNILLSGRYTAKDSAKGCIQRNFISVSGKITEKKIMLLPVLGGKNKDANVATIMKVYGYMSSLVKYINSPEVQASQYQLARNNVILKDPIPSIKLSPLSLVKDQFLITMQSIEEVQFVQNHNDSLLGDLYATGLFNLYHLANIYGKDDAEVIAELNRRKHKKEILEMQTRIYKKYMAELYQLNLHRKVIESKLGHERYNELKDKLEKPMTTTADILSLLTDKEKKIVLLEVDRKNKYLEAVINNKCPHVRIYKSLRRAKKNDDALKYLSDLKKFIDTSSKVNVNGIVTSTADEIIKCNNCGFNMICPHYLTILANYNRPYQVMKEKLWKYIAFVQSASGYYCKICGEIISSVDTYDTTADYNKRASMDDTLKDLIKTEIWILVKKLKLPPLINPNMVIDSVTENIYEFIFDAERKLLKSKTITSDDVGNQLKLIISIYAMAYLLLFVQANTAQVSAKKAKGTESEESIYFRDLRPRADLNEQLKYAIHTIIETRNIVISKLRDISQEYIKIKFRDAYKQLLSKGGQKIEVSSQVFDVLNYILLDPVYNYYFYINSIDAKLSGDSYKNIELIMGMTKKEMSVSEDLYAKVKLPNPKNPKWNKEVFDKLPKFSFSNNIHKSKKEAINALNGHAIASFDIFNYAVKNKIYTNVVTINGEYTDPYAKFIKLGDEVKEKEQNLMEYFIAFSSRNFYQRDDKNNINFKYIPVKYGHIYDERGLEHKFDIYVTKDGDFTKKDIEALLGSGKQFDKKIIDYRCSVCKMLKSDVNKLNETVILENIIKRQAITNLFMIFDIKCPIEGIHIWENEKCKKCGITFEMKQRILNDNLYEGSGYYPPLISYYNKYKHQAKVEKEEIGSDATSTEQPTSVKHSDENFGYDKWSFNFNIVLDLSNKVGIPNNLLMAVGGIEGLDYKKAKSGADVPLEPDEVTSTRVMNLKSYIYMVITKWNILRDTVSFIILPEWLTKVFNESKIEKHEFKILEELPDIYNKFEQRLSWFRTNSTPGRIVTFLVQTLCEKLLEIYNGDNFPHLKKTEVLRKQFVKWILDKIIKDEEMKSKYDKFKVNPSSFNSTRKELTEEDYNENYDEDYGLETENGVQEDKEQIGDDAGTTNEMFSMDGYDVDISDVDDDDDPLGDNDLKVEGYAFD